MKIKKRKVSDIQSVIMAALSLMTVVISVTIGLLLYNRYEMLIRQNDIKDTQNQMERLVNTVEQYLKDMRKISDSANYNIIQTFDVSSPEFNQQLSFLYDSNKDKIQSIALYGTEGELMAAEPVILQKKGVNAGQQPWFTQAMAEIENMHFSTPHIQNLFQDDAKRYHFVISLSRAVDVIDGDRPENGVLLVDLKYSYLEEMMNRMNDSNRGRYYYVCDGAGNLIYHPYYNKINRGLFRENTDIVCTSEDGVYKKMRSEDGNKQTVIISTIAYTGWKMVGVVRQDARTDSLEQFRIYMVVIVIMLIMMLLLVNRIVSKKISSPILKLDASVRAYEAGEKPDIYIGGSYEIRHLGNSIQSSYEEIERLMKEIMEEQNERRKSELAALQSQINPHFLYNTLESITWMVEANRNADAVLMISELAKLLRISLSKGKTIIRIADEIQHSKSYMSIQMVRYKERFGIKFHIDEEINDYCIVKLVIQPILENAIYYGVGDMDADEGGMITVTGRKIEEDIYISIEDNGMGMREEVVENILTDNSKVPKHGSGVGVINVHNRIQLMFGEEYGLKVESEADEGTKVTIHIPAIPFNSENQSKMEEKSVERKGKNEKK